MESLKCWWNAKPSGSKMLMVCGVSFGLGIGIGYFLRKNSWHLHKFTGSQKVFDYLMSTGNREVSELRDISRITRQEFGRRAMMISAVDQCYFFKWLLPMIKCEKAIEVGVFTGSSALMIAKGMPDHGQLKAFDVSKPFTDIARRIWQKAGVDHKITLSLDGGIAGLDALLEDSDELKTYDFAYIDAIKTEYSEYYDRLLPLMKKGGVIAFDNMMWKGKVAHHRYCDATTIALRNLTQKIKADQRVAMCLVSIGDGVLFVRVL